MTDLQPDYFERPLSDVDPEVAEAMDLELDRQRRTLEMIASENFVPQAVLECQGSVLTNKYAEGYPGKRYYGGCEYIDIIEQLAIDRAKALFGAEHANVQPHAGAQANTSAYHALLPNPLRRYPLACGPDPHTLGLRVPALDAEIGALAEMRWPVLQSSANAAGGIDAHRLEEVPEDNRQGADLVLDGGELAGTPSTVVDLRRFELDGMWAVLRQGAMTEREIEQAAADA